MPVISPIDDLIELWTEQRERLLDAGKADEADAIEMEIAVARADQKGVQRVDAPQKNPEMFLECRPSSEALKLGPVIITLHNGSRRMGRVLNATTKRWRDMPDAITDKFEYSAEYSQSMVKMQ